MIKFKFYKGEFDEKYEDVCKGIEEFDTRIDALRAEMNERFNAMNEKFNGLRTEMNERFNSSEKRFMMIGTYKLLYF